MATIDGSIAFGRQVVPLWWSRLSFSRRLGLRGRPEGLLEQDGLWLLTDAAHAGVFMVAFGRPEGRTWERAEVRYRAGPAGPVQGWWDLEHVRCAHCALDFDARGLPADVRGGLPVSLPSHLCLVRLVARYWTSDVGRFDAWRGRLVPAPQAPRAALDAVQYAPTPGLRAGVGAVEPVVPAVQRLPRITGRPPFTCKGARPGKPGLDRAEFGRQLAGQQDGLNRLTVAEFLANRDQYLTLRQLTGDGRDPLGDAAQKVAREKALRDKIEELLDSDEQLTRREAKAKAQQWLDTQAALHDPDQVAGGHPHLISGLGDARVNSSIGAQWPKRIKGIDAQIRKYAVSMTPTEQASTYLDIALPMA